MLNTEIYANAEAKAANLTKPTLPNHRIVLGLVECIEGTKRSISGDNWYSPVELLDEF